MPVPQVLASSTFIESSKMINLGPSANSNVFILLTWNATDARIWQIYGNNITPYKFDQLTTSNAVECRAARLGVSVTCQTAQDAISGTIRYVHLSDPLPVNFATPNTIDQDTLDNIIKICNDDGRVSVVSAASTAARPLKLYAHCSNLLKYASHQRYNNHVSGQEQTTFGVGQINSGMSSILLQFTTGSQAQSFQLHCISHDFLRFPEGSLLSATHQQPNQNHRGFERHAQQAAAAAAHQDAHMDPRNALM
jgi:hypothetical protein